MNDKQKQIEEMAEDIRQIKELQANSNIYTPNYQEAMALISLGYQKSKDKVVLSKEEYEALLLEQKRLREMVDRIPCGYVLKEEARKETAKEFAERLKENFRKNNIESGIWFTNVSIVDKTLKEFGVEL